MNDFLNNINSYQIIGVLFVVALIAHVLLGFILSKFAIRISSSTKNKLDDYLIKAISIPLKALIWFFWIFLFIKLFKHEILISYLNIVPIFIITWCVIRIVSAFEKYLIEKDSSVDQDYIRLFARLIKILISLAIVLGIAQYLGFSISSLLAFGGVGGIVMGFAAKDMLSNIFGGLMIQMDQPFSTGDWIRSSQFEGIVEKIGWRITRIRTFNKNPVYIPNSIFSTIPIETPSRMSNRRINEIIGVRYDDIQQLPDIVTAVQDLLKSHQDIDQSQTFYVYFNYFNASSLDFNISAFTSAIDKESYQKIKQQILLEIANIIDKHGAQIAYPTQVLHLQK